MEQNESSKPRIVQHIFSLRRGGHHPVMKWLEGLYGGGGMKVHFEDSIFNNLLPVKPHWPDPAPERLEESAAGSDVLILNYQDVLYERRHESPAYEAFQSAEVVDDIIVMRDWYNLAASRLKYIEQQKSMNRFSLVSALDWDDVASIWLEYANLAEAATKDAKAKPKFISYNKWATSREYRDSVAKSLGLTNHDEYVDYVPDFGFGSSFNGLTFQGKASEMNTLARWSDLATVFVPKYKEVLEVNPDEIDKINRRLFGIGREQVLKAIAD